MHSSLTSTTEGLPRGLTAIEFWTRSKFKGTRALKRRINPTRVPIEDKESVRGLANMRQSLELIGDPGRCIHIGDRENDILEFFRAAQDILKSGCKAEDVKLGAAKRLVNLIAFFCLLSWRIFWTTTMNRVAPEAPSQVAFTIGEIAILNLFVKDEPGKVTGDQTLSRYLMKVARLEGYFARTHDRPPGSTIMWRGRSRLAEIKIGAELAASTCG